jgi:hypothetical protein
MRSVPCTRRRGARVSWLSLKTKVNGLSMVCSQHHWDGFSWFGLKTDGDEFPDFGLKTGRYDLVIWASKSPQRFPSLGLKTKRAMVYRLCVIPRVLL